MIVYSCKCTVLLKNPIWNVYCSFKKSKPILKWNGIRTWMTIPDTWKTDLFWSVSKKSNKNLNDNQILEKLVDVTESFSERSEPGQHDFQRQNQNVEQNGVPAGGRDELKWMITLLKFNNHNYMNELRYWNAIITIIWLRCNNDKQLNANRHLIETRISRQLKHNNHN